MRSSAALLAGLASTVCASLFSSHGVHIEATWPPERAETVLNSQRNTLLLSVTNSDDKSYVLETVSGSFNEVGGREKALKNSTVQKYAQVIPAKTEKPLVVPYNFYSQFKPQELRLVVWADIASQEVGVTKRNTKKTVNRLEVFNGQVSVVEPPSSIFDIQLLLSYAMLAGLALGGGWLLLPTLKGWAGYGGPAQKTKRTTQPRAIPSPTKGSAVPGSPTKPVYEDEWVPELHKKQPKVVKATGRVNAADVVSGSEAEATDASTSSKKGRKKRVR